MRNAKILLVDDIEANIISLEYLLNDYFDNIDIISTSNGEEALKISFSQTIDFVILDIQMPNMDGFEVAKFLKLNPKTKNIPIIFLTAAFKEEEFQEKGFSLGAIDYLTKPINNHQFINKLKLYVEIFNKNIILQDILKENRKQKKVLQTILDTEKNLIIVTDFKEISFANKTFLNFYNVNTINEFVQKQPCFIDTITFKDKKIDRDNFYNHIHSIKEENRIVEIADYNGIKKFFLISISKTDDENNIYLISLTNVTSMVQTHKHIKQKAFHDELTGVYNRNKFNEVLELEIQKANILEQSFSCVLIDIDNFKKFNDTFGHLIGDEVLIILAQTINKSIRKSDFFARWGGEEFVLLLSNTQLNIALRITENIRRRLEKITHKTAGNISASFGVTEYKKGDTIESIFKRCDDALYQAKNDGKNCVRDA
jgi:diguanylate cyclase (GGDEF)-like protein